MSENTKLAEFANNMWNFIYEKKVKNMLSNHVSFYRARVVSNPADGTLVVIKPFDDTNRTVRCTRMMKNQAAADDEVLVLCFGNSGNAKNSIVVATASMYDFGILGLDHGGTGATSKANARANLGFKTARSAVSFTNGVGTMSVTGCPAGAHIMAIMSKSSTTVSTYCIANAYCAAAGTITLLLNSSSITASAYVTVFFMY